MILPRIRQYSNSILYHDLAGTIPGIDTYNKLIKTPTDYQLEIYGDPFCTLALITSNATLNTCGEVTIPLLGFGFYFKVTETVSSTTSSIAATATSQIASTVPISETKPAATAEDQPTDIPKGTLPPTPDQPNDAENNNSANPFVCLLAGMFVFEVLRFTSA
ncbi:hypothetical protein SARC_10692 [Sphaeroforma arctica JP610]|uniref:Uncharacterized protein n=1 Tax=Sphaeroforma arctica JP610 TaxID=667725 RepID=A0A0L0FJ69_9EUKA|nr:hypothetical protein SARC_10692 [Sphaeroforma arctica JP610]KNC76827.1 hypothetical protein SARC_10692 [Sphaeroforma arctica JP610]|eukprot:XP_014150729.1 hypothetical protein SARC_10692 [Sphaeroforma arctica JP610]